MRLLDTNVCIRLLNDAASGFWPKLRGLSRADVALCDVAASARVLRDAERHPLR